ncbi:MAG: arginase [Chthonomonadaceae bacterium]|nr:arginase [Chthonomonadaceae bacterium]
MACRLDDVIDLIGAPLDHCGKRRGTRLGPAALRLAGLTDVLRAQGIDVADLGDLPVGNEATVRGGLRNYEPALAFLKTLKERVAASLEKGRCPLVVGGDHALAMGSVAAAFEQYGDDLAVLWIDAHADLNTPGSSPSGNLHGMPLSLLSGMASGTDGLADVQWRGLKDALARGGSLRPNRLAWLGLREVDDGEKAILRSWHGAFSSTMQDIDRGGLVATMTRLDFWLRETGAKALWVSFDVDSLDPVLAPGTGTAVRGGLTYRESHLCAELLREQLDRSDAGYRLVGLDLVETNPLFDTNNQTATTAVEWIASLFGKTIL